MIPPTLNKFQIEHLVGHLEPIEHHCGRRIYFNVLDISRTQMDGAEYNEVCIWTADRIYTPGYRLYKVPYIVKPAYDPKNLQLVFTT